MKKILALLAIVLVLSCSKDDSNDCQEITGITAIKINDVWVYSIELDHGEPVKTNKATTDFYQGKTGTCFEGYK